MIIAVVILEMSKESTLLLNGTDLLSLTLATNTTFLSHINQKATDNNKTESVRDGLVVTRSYGCSCKHFTLTLMIAGNQADYQTLLFDKNGL